MNSPLTSVEKRPERTQFLAASMSGAKYRSEA
jgi:hypothetical protein